MVIQHFNKIIRNKWIWGVFALAISAFFAFDFLLADIGRDERSAGGAGSLGDREVSAASFRAVAESVRGFGRQRSDMPESEVNRAAWETLAAMDVAAEAGLTATDSEVRSAVLQEPAFKGEGGQFNMRAYEMVLRENGLTPEMFEERIKQNITLAKIDRAVLGAATWASPMEMDRAVDDMTDKFTVRLAYYTDKDAAKVKLDDAGLKAYYEEHTNSIALPDLVTVRYVKVAADDPARLKTFAIAEDALRDHYDATLERFETKQTTTNGEITVTKKFEEVKDVLERELQLIDSIEAARTNLLFRVYAQEGAAKGASRLDEIAKADGLKVLVSPAFAVDGHSYVKGFMSRPSDFVPGVDGFAAAAAELDPDAEELRYGVVAGTNAVYLIERASFTKAHVPSFEDAKAVIRADALEDARAKAFKESVEKKRALAAAALAKGGKFDAATLAADYVTTSYVFSVSSLRSNAFPDSRLVVGPVAKLSKGQISEFIPGQLQGKGILAYVEDRVQGDAADAQIMRGQLRDELGGMAGAAISRDWRAWNLARLGFTPNASYGTDVADEGSFQED